MISPFRINTSTCSCTRLFRLNSLKQKIQFLWITSKIYNINKIWKFYQDYMILPVCRTWARPEINMFYKISLNDFKFQKKLGIYYLKSEALGGLCYCRYILKLLSSAKTLRWWTRNILKQNLHKNSGCHSRNAQIYLRIWCCLYFILSYAKNLEYILFAEDNIVLWEICETLESSIVDSIKSVNFSLRNFWLPF